MRTFFSRAAMAALLVGALSIGASPAAAATLAKDPNSMPSSLLYTGVAGEHNEVVLASPGTRRISITENGHDNGQPPAPIGITIGSAVEAACAGSDPISPGVFRTVTCDMDVFCAGAPSCNDRVRARLGDMPDTFDGQGLSGPLLSYVDGEAGDDAITGTEFDDFGLPQPLDRRRVAGRLRARSTPAGSVMSLNDEDRRHAGRLGQGRCPLRSSTR